MTFGDGGDALLFTGGVVHTAGANVVNGNITTTDQALNLDNNATGTNVNGNSTLAAGTGQISLGDTVLADGATLILGTGGAGAVTVDSLAGTAAGAASNVTFKRDRHGGCDGHGGDGHRDLDGDAKWRRDVWWCGRRGR